MTTQQQLRSEFPSLAESMFLDVMRTEKDPSKARTILQSLHSTEPEEHQVERLIQELEQFKELGRETIISCLRENNWQSEAALLPLFTKLEEKRTQEATKRRKEWEDEQRAKTRAQANKFLRDLFAAVPEERIQQLLLEKDGDTDACVEELLRLQLLETEKRDKEDKQKQLRTQREEQVSSLAYRFEKSKGEIQALLEKDGWDFQKAVDKLLKDSQEALFVKMCKRYTGRDPMQVRSALERTDYDEIKATITIEETIAHERKTRDAKAQETAARELAKKLADEALKRAQEAREAAQKAVEESAKREAELKAAAAAVAEQKKKEAELEHQKRAEEARTAEFQKQKQEQQQARYTEQEIVDKNLLRTQIIMKDINTDKTRDMVKVTLEDYLREKGNMGEDAPSEPAKTDRDAPVSGDNNATLNVQTVILTTTAKAYDHDQPISVSWTLPTCNLETSEATNAPGGPNDWIGLYREGAPNKNYTYYEWTSAHKGTAAFATPTVPGVYVFRYFVNRSYSVIGTSNSFVVGPSYTLTPTIGEKNQVKINVEQTFGKLCPKSWVGLYEPSKPNNSYATYENVGDKKEITFTVPKASVWEFRLFPTRAYDLVTSCKVDVNGDTKLSLALEENLVVLTFNISTLDPNTDKVWFGIYHVEEKNNRYYRRCQYIKASLGKTSVNIMKTPGTYEARLFANGNTGAVICRSNTVTIPAPSLNDKAV